MGGRSIFFFNFKFFLAVKKIKLGGGPKKWMGVIFFLGSLKLYLNRLRLNLAFSCKVCINYFDSYQGYFITTYLFLHSFIIIYIHRLRFLLML